ncbi:1-acyl-sn-glycerol-3-phosphate acyltransferase [Flavobacterium pallidum]|uniref:Acyltransferase n=1 Tax=Flavobacterium pallidum TaxID=2172098 RepID=A0A2S1SKH3_9FLAO|nr:1-acyl-sn-glycerol-3-phosphate acyltransferase [Flavobacterium pallidum]AWI26910.1 acyltransferase [Flavobacterium pallidum]
MKRLIYKVIFFRLMGWRITGMMDPGIRKSVLMIVPHTSWMDFFIGLFARGIIGLEMHWVGKKELFQFPLNGYFRWMGGAPLDRSGGRNTVDAVAGLFAERKVFRMAIAPEGTRKAVITLKSGFYYIALKADVPIIPIAFDYGRKEVALGKPFYPTGNEDADVAILLRHFEGVTGKFPENGFGYEK